MNQYMEVVNGNTGSLEDWVGYEKADGTMATMADVLEDVKAGRLIEVRKTKTAAEKAEYGDWMDADI